MMSRPGWRVSGELRSHLPKHRCANGLRTSVRRITKVACPLLYRHAESSITGLIQRGGHKMKKRMVNVAVLVAVLTVAVLGPSTTFAAPRGTQMANIEARSGVSLFDMFLRLIGFDTVSHSKPSPVQKTTPSGNGISTETATWTGGRCPFGC